VPFVLAREPEGAVRSAWSRYGIAVLAVGLALVLKLLLDPLAEGASPFLLFFGAVIVGAWFGGLGPGLFATALATLASDYFFLPPTYSLLVDNFEEGLRLALFVLEGTFISLLVATMRSARRQAEARTLQSRRDQEALKESEERYRVVAETASDAIIVIDEDSQILFVNGAAEKVFGYAREEMLGERLTMLMPEYLRHLHRAGLERYLDTGRRHLDWEAVQLPGLHKSGKEIPLEVSFGEFTRDGRRFFTGFVRDITERQRAEEALRESEDRLSLTVESTGLGTWDFNPVTEDLRWDARCKAMFGLPPEAGVDYKTFLEGLHPEDRERTHQAVQRALDPSGGGGFDAEYRTVGLEDGVERWVVARGQAFFDEAGRAVRFIGTVLDITERKKNEEALRQSERLYRTVIEQARENIFLVDVETRRIVESNPAFRRTLGYAEEELEGMTLYDIVAADRESIDRNVRRVLEQKGHSIGERKYRRKDGSLADIEVSASIILRDGRETLCVVAHDVTERKKNEEAQRFLAEAGASLSSSLDYRATLSRMARLAVPHLADWCAVDVLEEDGSLDRLAVVHEDPEKVALAYELERRYPTDPEAPYGVPQVLRTGRSEFVQEIPDSLLDEIAVDVEHRELLRELGLKSYVIVPLVARGRTLGAITLVSAESGRRYGTAELELVEELARRAALAVDNARLYRGRSEIARTLQGSLLPSRLPEVPGVEVGLSYLPAGEVDVGGDFYDLFDATRADGEEEDPSEPSSSWGVAIGDVCGKGAEAAAMLALARHTIRAVAMRETHPAAVLAGLNEAMLRQRRERDDYKFCTIAYARLETGEGDAEHGARITVSCGGHAAPVLLKADGSIRKLECSGRALGVFDDANLAEQETYLAPGDALVLYTDGVIEARSPDGTFFGEERLTALLRSSADLDASTLASRIESAVLEFQENDPRDDVAVLVLRVQE
jgi:PAS domain S-box-containing protein